MTQAQLGKKIANTLATWVARMMHKFHQDVERYGEEYARKLWREEYGLIFRKQYTVPARFRHYKEVLFTKLPADSKKTLQAQSKTKVKIKPKHTAATEEQLERWARQSSLN